MSARPISVLVFTIAGGLLACGGRSSLEVFDAQGDGGSNAQGGSGGGGGAGQGGSGGIIAPPVCSYQSAGDPIIAISLPDRHANAAALVTTNADPEQGPLEIGYQYFASGGSSPLHSENPISRIRVNPGWPNVEVAPPLSAGVESHSYSLLAPSRSGNRIGLTWYTDLNASGRIAFRTIDVATNALGAIFDIELGAQSPAALKAGSAINTSFTEYVGDGYGIAWRRKPQPGGNHTTAMAILNDEGAMLAGPHDVTPQMKAPPSSSMVWSGSNYLIAAGYDAFNCAPNEPLCEPKSLVVMRYRKASGNGQDDSGIDTVAVIPKLSTSNQSGRPELLHHAGRTWLTWAEAIPKGEPTFVVFRLVELAADGTPIGAPQEVFQATTGFVRISVNASDQGLAYSWFEKNPKINNPQQLGAFFLHVLALDYEGKALGEQVIVPTTEPQGRLPSLTTLGGKPRSLLVGWSAYRESGGLDVGMLTRLSCSEVGPEQ